MGFGGVQTGHKYGPRSRPTPAPAHSRPRSQHYAACILTHLVHSARSVPGHLALVVCLDVAQEIVQKLGVGCLARCARGGAVVAACANVGMGTQRLCTCGAPGRLAQWPSPLHALLRPFTAECCRACAQMPGCAAAAALRAQAGSFGTSTKLASKGTQDVSSKLLASRASFARPTCFAHCSHRRAARAADQRRLLNRHKTGQGLRFQEDVMFPKCPGPPGLKANSSTGPHPQRALTAAPPHMARRGAVCRQSSAKPSIV